MQKNTTTTTQPVNKQVIKKLAHAINEELGRNAYGNEMNHKIDYGEWGQTEPDFTQIIKDWKLDRGWLCAMADQAEFYAQRFGMCIPSITRTNPKSVYKYGPYITNPWDEVAHMLHCVFMAGNLAPVDENAGERYEEGRQVEHDLYLSENLEDNGEPKNEDTYENAVARGKVMEQHMAYSNSLTQGSN